MNFEISKKELSSLTTLVHRAASHIASRNNIPTLAGILIELEQGKGLTITATDLEIGLKASTQAVDVITPGKFLVNANLFSDFIKLLPDTDIQLELDPEKNKLKVSYGRSFGYINLYAAEEYPELPIQDIKNTLKISQNTLRNALKKTVFAAANQHFRQIFTGVLFDVTESGELHVVASDTHRLAYYRCRVLGEDNKAVTFIVPVRAVNELLRVMEDSEELITIGVSDNNVVFSNDRILLFSRMIDGQYPNYENVIPSELTTETTIPSGVIVSALERARTMPPDDKFKIPMIKLGFTPNEINIVTVSEKMGEIKEFIDGIEVTGNQDFTIAFNTNYFLDIAKLLAAENDTIRFRLSGAFGAAIIDNPEKEEFLYVLVPLRGN